jgi:membrane-bound lytic murein transglycosylase D
MKNNHALPVVKILSVATSIIAIVLVFNLFVHSSIPESKPDEDMDEVSLFQQNYSIHALPMPDTLSFAGEPVPMNKTYVRESYDRELLVNTYWQSQTLLLIKRANRYFPVIEPILEAEGVPSDFKYLPLIESGFQERVVSPAGAAGVWQFLEGAARDYNLEVNAEVDERYHIEKSTVAACRYLKKAYARFGSWTMAAAAYNAGPRGMERQVDRQKITSYYDLLLNEETGRYVFRILAIKSIMAAPQKFGFHLGEDDLYPVIPTNELVVTGAIPNFADFAVEHGTTYRELKDLNPWLRETFLLNPNKKNYTLKIPRPGSFEVK